MMDTRDCQVSFTFGPCDYHQEVSLRSAPDGVHHKAGFHDPQHPSAPHE